MADLFDYLDWRGDLSFMNSPANEADYYLISKIGCPDLTGIVPEDEQEADLVEVVEAYRAHVGNDSVSLGIATSPLVLDSFYRLPSVPENDAKISFVPAFVMSAVNSFSDAFWLQKG